METTSRSHKAREAKLRADIEAHIAKGGVIKHIPFGESSLENGFPVEQFRSLEEKRKRGWVRSFGEGL